MVVDAPQEKDAQAARGGGTARPLREPPCTKLPALYKNPLICALASEGICVSNRELFVLICENGKKDRRGRRSIQV